MSTLATPIRNRRQLEDPSCVKVVFDGSGRALYFSRIVIPGPREWDDRSWRPIPPVSISMWAFMPIAGNFC